MDIDISKIDFSIGDSPFANLARVDRFYIASRIPGIDGVNYMINRKVFSFIDLKCPGEVTLNEHDLLMSTGGEYINCPISQIAQMDMGFLNNMKTLLEEREGDLLLYCMSGNRIIAWLMLHLGVFQHYSETELYQFAKKFPFVREETRQLALEQLRKLVTNY